MSSDKTIGEVIAEAREEKNLSQRQLAKLAGINSSGLSKIDPPVICEVIDASAPLDACISLFVTP